MLLAYDVETDNFTDTIDMEWNTDNHEFTHSTARTGDPTRRYKHARTRPCSLQQPIRRKRFIKIHYELLMVTLTITLNCNLNPIIWMVISHAW